MVTEQEMLLELKKGGAKAFEQLYRRQYKMVEDLVKKLGGNSEDAQDIFQEALFVLVKKIREPEFQLTGKISTLLYAIARNKWLRVLKKNAPERSVGDDNLLQLKIEEAPVSPEEKEIMIAVMFDKINALDEDCRAVIKYTFFKNLSHSEVGEIMGYSDSFVRVKKFRCLEYLRKLVRESPLFRNR